MFSDVQIGSDGENNSLVLICYNLMMASDLKFDELNKNSDDPTESCTTIESELMKIFDYQYQEASEDLANFNSKRIWDIWMSYQRSFHGFHFRSWTQQKKWP
ncbi:hypothetical protein LIER_15523 [Lithospermum erythrorhizon]|uniref:Uncharacterized protein n=1 Tax=Lithospermum erythrorhizon TaxID=34254 RepID=A0AAV3Q5M8_LITER